MSNGLRRRTFLGALGAAGATLGLPPLTASAASPPGLYFAGHAFLVRFADIGAAFPKLSKFLTAERSAALEAALVGRARRPAPGRSLDLKVDELARLGPGHDAYVLALAFDRETIQASRIGSTWKLLVELSFQVLVFDFRTRTVAASYPLATQYIDASPERPDDAAIERALERLVFGEQPTGLQATFWTAVDAATPPRQGSRTLKVTEASLAEPAAAALHQLGVPDLDGVRDQFAHDFGKFLSTNQRLPLLPYASSQAVGGKMAARFADGSVYTLSTPEPDYSVALRLDGLKKVQTAQTAAGSVWIYGAFVTVRVTEPLSGRTYFDGQVKLGAPRTLPPTLAEDDDWPSYAEVVQQLFNEFTGAVSGPDDVWARKHLVAAGAGAAQLKPLKDLLESCR